MNNATRSIAICISALVIQSCNSATLKNSQSSWDSLPLEFEGFSQAKYHCITNVSRSLRTKSLQGNSVVVAAITGTQWGATDVESGTRPLYEQCMADLGYAERAVADRPEDARDRYFDPRPAPKVSELKAGETVSPDGWIRTVAFDTADQSPRIVSRLSPEAKVGPGKDSLILSCVSQDASIEAQFGSKLDPSTSEFPVWTDGVFDETEAEFHKTPDETALTISDNEKVTDAFKVLGTASKARFAAQMADGTRATRTYDLKGFLPEMSLINTVCGLEP